MSQSTRRAARYLFIIPILLVGPRLFAQSSRAEPGSAAGRRAEDRFTSASIAWDAGRYLDAVDGFHALLNGPDSAAYLERIALVSGEKWRTTLVAENARAPRW